MKKTRWTALFADIRKTWVSFLSIALFVALGIGIFLGIKWNEPALSEVSRDYYNAHSYHDLKLVFPYGLTEDDLNKVKSLDGVAQVEGAYSAYGQLYVGEERYIIVIQSQTDSVDVADILEGREPIKQNEIGIERMLADSQGLKVGDKITIDTKNGDKSYLYETEFTITAIVEHPSYIRNENTYSRGICSIGDGTVDYYVTVPKEAFDSETYADCYSELLVRGTGFDKLTLFSEEYRTSVNELEKKIRDTGIDCAYIRTESVYTNALEKISDAKAQINKAELELEKGKAEIEQAKEKIKDAEKEIEDGSNKILEAEEELKKGYEELEERREKLQKAEKEIKDAEDVIRENESLLNEARAEYENGLIEYNENSEKLQEALSTIQSGLIEAGFSEDLDTALIEIENKKTELGGLKSQAQEAISTIDSALEYLDECKDDPESLDPEHLANILTPLAQNIMSDPDSVAKIRVVIEESKEILNKYLEDPSSLTEAEFQTLEELISKFGYELNEEGAQQALAYVETAEGILDMLVENPELVTEENMVTLMGFMISSGYTPDIEQTKSFLNEKKAELNSNIEQIDDANTKLTEAIEGIEEYKSGKSQLEEARKKLDSALQKITDGEEKLDEAKEKVTTAKQEYADGKAKFEENERKYNDGVSELALKKTELENAESELLKAKEDLPQAEVKIADGEKELNDKKSELLDAEKQMESFVRYDNWTIQTRDDNTGYSSAEKYAVSSTKLCFSMATLFVFVGMMVCYTSVSRNVHEAQVITGVQKALGFRKSEITLHYMTYSSLAVIIGAVCGALLAFFVIETIVNHAYERMLVITKIPNVFRIADTLAISAVELLLILFSTWVSCNKLLKKPAIELLRGNSEILGRTHFYEKTKWWNKLSLYTQATINNLCNDKPRVIATLVGVAGCTALVFTGLSLQLSLQNTPKKHFDKIWTFDSSLVSDNGVEGSMENLCSVLDDEKASYVSIRQEAAFVSDSSGKLSKADLIVPQNKTDLTGYINLRDYKTKNPLEIPDDGIIISRSYQKHHDINVGDTITLTDMSGVKHECVIKAVSEHYLSTTQVVMSRDYYEKTIGNELSENTVYLKYNDIDPEKLQERLTKTDGYFSLTNERDRWSGIFARALESTTLVVYICLFLSAVMALMVLLNLNVIAISEKKRELIIMRINGFSIAETKKYVYRDNIFLTAIGIILGVGAGYGLSVWILNVLQSSTDNFLTELNPVALAVSAGLTVVFAVITNLIALRKIDKLKASDLDRQ